MGCGKSSVGRRLSELLSCPFHDLDTVVERRSGRSIPEIFGTDGEQTFRQMELEALESVIGSCPENACMVLSLGGGTVMTPECASLIHEKTVCIYLRASTETLAANLEGETGGRPMLNNPEPLRERISSLMSRRSETYEATAHIIEDTDGKTVEEIAEKIYGISLAYHDNYF